MGYWLGVNEVGLGTSIFLSGVGVAGIFTPVLITRMAIAYGWRAPFLVVGLIGILARFVCYSYVTERPQHNPRLHASELALIAVPCRTEVTPSPAVVLPL